MHSKINGGVSPPPSKTTHELHIEINMSNSRINNQNNVQSQELTMTDPRDNVKTVSASVESVAVEAEEIGRAEVPQHLPASKKPLV